MALTESTMLALGSEAPAFALPDVTSSNIVRLDDFRGTTDALVVMFICAHCPFVKHVQQGLAAFGKDYLDKPVGIVAISSNDAIAHRDDRPEYLSKQAQDYGFTFPYLYDETQEVGRAYEAACTPDFFLYDAELRLAYRGQLDDSRPRRGDFGNDTPVTGKDLRAAMDAVIAGKQPATEQKTSIGCNIKWRQ